MSDFFLPKGTIVKHGTSLCRLNDILTYGLSCNNKREETRSTVELTPEINGIYIGELISYFASYTAYSFIVQSYLSKPENLSLFSLYYESPKKISSLKLSALPVTLPVVLNIQLEDDCLLYADEDFVFDGKIPVDEKIPEKLLINESKSVWDKWKTGCIVRSGGIPKSWIKYIEYPRIGNLSGSTELHKDTWADSELFASGVMQAGLKELPIPLMKSYKKSYGRVELSQRVPATKDGIDKILSLNGMNNINNQYFTHIQLTQTFDHIAENYGIPLHRAQA